MSDRPTPQGIPATGLAALAALLAFPPSGEQPQDWEQALIAALEADPATRAVGMEEPGQGAGGVQLRVQQLRSLWPLLQEQCQTLLHGAVPLDTAWRLWLPFSQQLVQHHRALNRPWVQGILGGQGTGKSTLVALLATILQHWGYRVCCLSIDDFYKTYAERQQLQRHDPRLIWRGPPGTHDVELGLRVLTQLRSGTVESIAIPRFDKSAQDGMGDRAAAEWVSGVDIVLFEGWFVGARPIDPIRFDMAPPPIVTESDRAFARDCNARLHAYLPLWDQLDSLMVLYPRDYRLSQQWRRQAEHRLIASHGAGMNDAQIDEFVAYFWRSLHPDLFITPLLQDTQRVEWVVELNADHSIHRIDRPGPHP